MKMSRRFTFLLAVLIVNSATAQQQHSFIHRGYLGWMIDMSRTARENTPWPAIIIDSPLLSDYNETLDFLERSKTNEITIWGLFTSTSWEPEISKTIDGNRQKQIKEIIAKAHEKGIKIICGVGVYSWGFNKIIAEHPEVRCSSNPELMDLAKPEAFEWQKKVLDYLTDNYDFDGFSLQSADRGVCKEGGNMAVRDMEYHARLNQKVVNYIRSKRKNYVIGISGWGMDMGNPKDLESIISMSENVDYIIDVYESALKGGQAYRRKLIEAIKPCVYGNTGTPNVEPIQALPRDAYFVPTVKRTTQRSKQLFSDGGLASETYYRTRGNPGDEITGEALAATLKSPERNTDEVLKEALAFVYEVKDPAVLETLLQIYYEAEDAYFKYGAGDKEIILLIPRESLTPSSHFLSIMSTEDRLSYKKVFQELAHKAEDINGKIGNRSKLELLQLCLNNTLSQLEAIRANVESK